MLGTVSALFVRGGRISGTRMEFRDLFSWGRQGGVLLQARW